MCQWHFDARSLILGPLKTLEVRVEKRSDEDKLRLLTTLNEHIAHTFQIGVTVEKVEGEELTLRLPYAENLVGDP